MSTNPYPGWALPARLGCPVHQAYAVGAEGARTSKRALAAAPRRFREDEIEASSPALRVDAEKPRRGPLGRTTSNSLNRMPKKRKEELYSRFPKTKGSFLLDSSFFTFSLQPIDSPFFKIGGRKAKRHHRSTKANLTQIGYRWLEERNLPVPFDQLGLYKIHNKKKTTKFRSRGVGHFKLSVRLRFYRHRTPSRDGKLMNLCNCKFLKSGKGTPL